MTETDQMIDTIKIHAKTYTVGTISQKIVAAMRTVNRLNYGGTYGDHACPIGHGQTMSQPFMVAIMSHVLNVHANDHVLEIGTGSGYQAAILAAMATRVDTIERIDALYQSAAVA